MDYVLIALVKITSEGDLILCGTKVYLYKLCSREKYQHIVENIHYCANCVKASIPIDEVVVSETDKLKHTFDKEYNDDCVSVFQKV